MQLSPAPCVLSPVPSLLDPDVTSAPYSQPPITVLLPRPVTQSHANNKTALAVRVTTPRGLLTDTDVSENTHSLPAASINEYVKLKNQ
jgi:hypothetical protein